MLINITLQVDEGDPSVDLDSRTGITNEAYAKLTGEDSYGPLDWLGEVQDVTRVDLA